MRVLALLSLIFCLCGGLAMAEPAAALGYRLGTNDKIRVTVFGEPDLSGDFMISGTGALALPLVGAVNVGGMTIQEVEQALATRLKQGILNNPKISVEVLNYRPFYILGEINNPGSYQYVDGMRVLNAIAVGGGFTYRADKGDIKIRREENGKTVEVKVKQETLVMPGDVVEVGERFF